MLQPKAFAHAVTIVTALFYIICAILVYTVPDFVFNVSQSWVHGLNLQVVRAQLPLELGSLVWGLITISVVTWITTYAAIVIYNRLAK